MLLIPNLNSLFMYNFVCGCIHYVKCTALMGHHMQPPSSSIALKCEL